VGVSLRRVAAIELGGSKVLATVGTGPGDCAEPVRIATGSPAETLAAAAEALDRFRIQGLDFAAVGVASFGPVFIDQADRRYGRIGGTPKPGWSGADVLAPFRRFGVPLAIDTDVNAAALAEARWGAGAGADELAYVTVGTGVGVGLLVGDRPVHGTAHPEAGHLMVRRPPDDTFPGACPWHGDCVEGMICGPALKARTGADPSAVAVDDPVWGLVGEYLGQLCQAIVLMTSPAVIVVGGGVGSRPEVLAAARRSVERRLGGYVAGFDAEARLRPPGLGPASGLMGALGLGSGLGAKLG